MERVELIHSCIVNLIKLYGIIITESKARFTNSLSNKTLLNLSYCIILIFNRFNKISLIIKKLVF